MNLSFGLSVAAVGILVVLFRARAFNPVPETVRSFCLRNAGKRPLPAPVESKTPAPQEAPAPVAADPGVSADVIAAITAAVSAVWQEESGFIVRRVRRIHTAPAWNRAGRDDQIFSRL